jgi:hypothetical protein
MEAISRSFWDGSTTTQLTDNNGMDFGLKIHNGLITWYGWDGNDWEIFYWDGTVVTQLTSNSYEDSHPAIHDGCIIWNGNDSNDFEIYCFDGISQVQLTNNDFHDLYPQIHDGQATWQGFDGNDDEIFVLTACAAPVWIIAPTDQTLEYGETLDYQLGVDDDSGISHWTLNDTTNFALSTIHSPDWGSSCARITSLSTLSPGAYGLSVTVHDLQGLMLSAFFTVTVLLPPPDLTLPLLALLAGVSLMAVVAVVLLIIQRRKS